MNFILSLASDLLNGFSANDIPVFLARIFAAALVAFIFRYLFKRKYKDSESKDLIKYMIPLSMLVAIIVPIAQFSIALGIIMAAFILALFRRKEEGNTVEYVYVLMSLLSASAIGAGYVVFTFLGLIFVWIYLIIAKH